jgi:hypothetical protein
VRRKRIGANGGQAAFPSKVHSTSLQNKPGNTLTTLVKRGRLGPTATAPQNLRPRGCRSRPALRLDKGGNLMTRLVLAALVLLNCASFTTKLFAQASQTAPPVPLTAPSVNTTTLTCQINCDSQAMSCQNFCVPTTAAATSGATGGGAACNLNCSTQQLVCKQRCN